MSQSRVVISSMVLALAAVVPCFAGPSDGGPLKKLPVVSLAVANDMDDSPMAGKVVADLPQNDRGGGPERKRYEAGVALDAPMTVLPETTTVVKLSSSDLNRFICSDDDAKDARTSEEKGLMIDKINGRDVFVKFKLHKRSDGKLSYSTTPTELFIKCGAETFSMVAFPDKVPTQTIRLASGRRSKIEANGSLYAGMPFEKRIMRVIKEVYADQIPESYMVTLQNKVDMSFKGLVIALRREVDVEGEGVRVKEYAISLRQGQQAFKLSEKAFLRKEFALNPVAVSIDRHHIRPGDTARMFIVEQQQDKQSGGGGLQLPALDGDSINSASGQGGNRPVTQQPSSVKPPQLSSATRPFQRQSSIPVPQL